MKRRWTKKEIEFLRINYGEKSPKECAEILGRTCSSTKQKAIRMGFGKERRNFTDQEIEFLEANYETKGPKWIAKKLGRKECSIIGKANRNLGIKRSSKQRAKNTIKTHTGLKRSKATRERISESLRKYPNPNHCADCGKKIYKKSIRCRQCNLRMRRGEGHNWWNGGVSVLYQMVQHKLYVAWKFPILTRDDFACQECGRHDSLEVHHLRKFVEIRDKVMKENPNLSLENYKDRQKLASLIVIEHDIKDGITLCCDCHKACHFENRVNCGDIQTDNAVDNPQPSRGNVLNFVPRKVQRLTVEDTQANKTDTSARLPKSLG